MKKRQNIKTLIVIGLAFCVTVSCATRKDAAVEQPVIAPPLEGTIWRFVDQHDSWYQKFFAGGGLLLIDQAAVNNTWEQHNSKVYFSANGGQISYEGEFADDRTIIGSVYDGAGSPREFVLILVTDPAITDQYTHQEIWENGSVFPPFTTTLRGLNEVRIRNPNSFSLSAAVRDASGGAQVGGIDLNVPAVSYNSVFIPNGSFEIFFVFSNEPDTMYRGDDFFLEDYGFEIEIMPDPDGNYIIHRVY